MSLAACARWCALSLSAVQGCLPGLHMPLLHTYCLEGLSLYVWEQFKVTYFHGHGSHIGSLQDQKKHQCAKRWLLPCGAPAHPPRLTSARPGAAATRSRAQEATA